MAGSEDDFECWLSGKLRDLNTDEGVFGTYIKGILEGEETLDDKTEALEGILSEITENDIPKHCREILERWQNLSRVLNSQTKSEPEEDVEVKLVRLLESQSLPTVAPKSYTEEERKIREAILAQYSQMSDNEEDETVEKGGDSCSGSGAGGTGATGVGGSGGSSALTRNTNAEEVHKAEREKREKARLESQRKKDKDKEDREKQKQLQQEKKEKRKTQKGERRR